MNKIMKILLECGNKHPAYSMNFLDLKENLLGEVEKGNINVKYHPDFNNLALFKYSQNCVIERNWNMFTLMARGLILDLKNEKIIASPFLKFFNFGEIEEGSRSIVQSDFTVTEKVDGSLAIMYFFNSKWRIATSGSFQSEQANWANDWMNKNISLHKLCKNNTYLFEAIYPENKIVVKYDFSGLVLLSIIGNDGLEYDYEMVKKEANSLKIKYVKKYNFKDMNSIIENSKKLDRNQEGYVIHFKNGTRLKIKGDEYVRIHKLISKVTPLSIWELLLNGDCLEDLKKELPEELEKDFDNIVLILENNLCDLINEIEHMYENTKNMTDKELGLSMQRYPRMYEGGEYLEAKRYIFMRRKKKFHKAINDFGSAGRRKIFNLIRPKGNLLKGYVPSSLVNRFTDDI